MMRALTGMTANVTILLSFLGIAAAMVMTVADIVVRTAGLMVAAFWGTRPQWGVFGLVDLTQLAMMTAVPLAVAAAFFAAAHVRIDVLTNALPAPARRVLAVVAAAFGLSLTGVCLWTGWNVMRDQLDFTTTSATLSLPYTWYWLPLLLGLSLSVIACAVDLIRALAPDKLRDTSPENV